MGTAALLAHQGGWDEMLMAAAPIAIFYLILRAANRRARRMAQTQTPALEESVPDASLD